MYDDNKNYIIFCCDCEMSYIVSGKELNQSISGDYECYCGKAICVEECVEEYLRSI